MTLWSDHIKAPLEVPVHRKEVFAKIQREEGRNCDERDGDSR